MPTLTIQLPGLPPVAHVLREETTTIGRMKGSTIVIDDTSVSLMHAKITRTKEGEYFLKDLNSTNGTLINGQTVREVKLQDLDQICFADVIAQFHAEAAAAVQPIVPLMPAPAKAPGAPTAPGAPQLSSVKVGGAPPPPAPVPIAEAGTKRRSRTNGNGVTHLADKAVPILGGVAVLVVVGLVVWKLAFSGKQETVADKNTPTAVSQTSTDGKKTPDAKSGPSAQAKKAPPMPPMPKVENANVSRLLTGLKDADVEERRRAARTLHSMGDEAKEATAALRVALKDADQEVQMWSALTLVNTKSYDKAAIPILVRSLHHENPTLRQVACLSLAVIPYEAAEKDSVVPALATAAANDDDTDVRQAAYSALSIIAPEIVSKANETSEK
jgi:pSer/pThr/pTyr-binding forkhead associated (FHA) protein